MTRTFQKPIKRIVVKLGSSQIVDEKFKARRERLNSLARQISHLHKKYGIEVVLVSSGAIALGMGELGEHKRPTELADLQARAAIGQALLMRVYSEAFKKVKLKCAQVLLTWHDFDKSHFLNARHTFEALLKKEVVPIINENDTTSTEEIKFGDNDKLSALVTKALHADLLVILSDVDGLLNDKKEVYQEVKDITPEIITLSGGTSNAQVARGGMKTKIDAVQIVREARIPCIIAGGNVQNVLVKIISGEPIGTYFTV